MNTLSNEQLLEKIKELRGALVPYQKEIAATRRTETLRVRKVARDRRLSELRDRRTEKSLATSKVATGPAKCQSERPSRYIPADVRHAVTTRDGNRCSYVVPDGTRCRETRNLELDHIEPWALGGKSTFQNLRQVCRAHNQLYAERVFGREFLQRVINAKQ